MRQASDACGRVGVAGATANVTDLASCAVTVIAPSLDATTGYVKIEGPALKTLPGAGQRRLVAV